MFHRNTYVCGYIGNEKEKNENKRSKQPERMNNNGDQD